MSQLKPKQAERYLIDTNGISELIRDRPNPSVADWFDLLDITHTSLPRRSARLEARQDSSHGYLSLGEDSGTFLEERRIETEVAVW